MNLFFYTTYALRALRRGGQRTLLAIVAVAFGVMALVAMQTLASNIFDVIGVEPRLELGGDLELTRPQGYLDDDAIAQLDALREDGRITDYTLIASIFDFVIKPLQPEGRTEFIGLGYGIEPAKYPLLGDLTLREPSGATLAETIDRLGMIAITRDLADSLGLRVGDNVLAINMLNGLPHELTVGAVIATTPDSMGSRAFYNLATAQQLANNAPHFITTVSVLAPDDTAPLVADLEATGWNVTTPEVVLHDRQNVDDVFNFMLKGAGILGLLVGGIGVANTMQVLLARRTTEIAILKTLGYRPRHLMAMFGMEVLLIGLAGSLIGLVAAILLSIPLTQAMERTGSMLLDWRLDPLVLAGGVLAGVATALIFGVYAITRASGVRPSSLLRRLPIQNTWRHRFEAVGIYALLAVPFGLLSTLVMGSLFQGIGIIVVALAGLVALGVLLGGALFVATRVPMPRVWLLNLARNNLKRQMGRMVFALIALFVGVFAIGFSAAAMFSARAEFSSRLWGLEGENLVVFGRFDQEDAIEAVVDGQPGVESFYGAVQVELQSATYADGDAAGASLQVPRVKGYTDIDDGTALRLVGEPWATTPNAIYLSLRYQYGSDAVAQGTRLQLVGVTGQSAEVVVAGYYTSEGASIVSHGQAALVPRAISLALGGDQGGLTYVGTIDPDRLDNISAALHEAVPNLMVITGADMRAAYQSAITNLYVFAIGVAGLALVAGAVLIANSVGLSMIERRREIGVLKAVGYGTRHVLSITLLEHALLGLLAGVSGILAVQATFVVLTAMEEALSMITLGAVPALAIVLVATLLTIASALAVAWGPTHVRPMVVLRDE